MSRVVYGTIDIQAVSFAEDEVVVTVAWGRMNAPGSGLTCLFCVAGFADIELHFRIRFASKRYVFAYHQQRRPIQPGMTAFKPIQF